MLKLPTNFHVWFGLVENLWPDSVYEASVEAANQFGWSSRSKIFYLSTSSRGNNYSKITIC